MILYPNLYAQCRNRDKVQAILGRLLEVLVPFSPRPLSQPERYWKIEESFHFVSHRYSATRENHERLLALAERGWYHIESDNYFSFIWNKEPDQTFLLPEV